MKPLFISLIFLITCCLCHAQQIDLAGRVSIHNSGYRTGNIQYVPNAYVSAEASTPTQTDSGGAFELLFQGVEAGALVDVTVEKDQLEVVNDRELAHVVLGRTTPLRIFLAHPDSLARAQAELREVSLAAVTTRYDALIARLRAGEEESRRVIEELQAQLNREIAHRFEAEEILQKQLEALKERLPEMARDLARINLDFASEVYRKAYELYRQGELEQAISVLDEAELSVISERIIGNLASLEEDRADYETALAAEEEKVDQILQSYRLKAEGHNLLFQYREAAAVQRKVVNILETLMGGEETRELADAYGTLGTTLQNMGNYLEALDYQTRNAEMKERLLDFDDPKLADSYNNLALTYMYLGNYIKALSTQEKAIAIIERVYEYDHPRKAIVYNNLASMYMDIGDYEQGVFYQQKAIVIQEQAFDPDHGEIATSYNNLASVFRAVGDYPKALLAQQKSISIRERILVPDHPLIAASYSNLAAIYMEFGDYNEALAFQQKAIVIQEEILDQNHPSTAISYNNLASIQKGLGNTSIALIAQQKALSIQEQIFGPDHPEVATSYNNLATIYQDAGDYANALIVQQKGVSILEKVLAPDHPLIAASYSNLAGIFQALGDPQQALALQQKALVIREKVLEPDHPSVAISYHNLASIYFVLNRLDSALLYDEKSYAILSEKLPDGHPTLEIIAKNLAPLFTHRARQHLSSERYYQAISDYQQALRFSSDKGELYNQLGLAYYFVKDYTKAAENYEASHRLGGVEQWIYLNNTGLAYAKAGRFAEAHVRLTQLEQLMPYSGLPYCDWGLYYTLTGNYELALANFEKAIQFGYTDKNWLQTEEALAPLRELSRFQELLDRIPDE